jgi:GNAT superfamily N-acetyltransferase
MRRRSQSSMLRGSGMAGEIQAVTGEYRDAAVGLLVRFFREEGFATPPARIAENLDRMLADSAYWCALVAEAGAARAIVTVSTVLYVEWGRLGEIGDLYVLPEYRRRGLARRLVERAKDWCRAQSCSAVSVTITSMGERRHGLSQFYARLGFEQTDRMTVSAVLKA